MKMYKIGVIGLGYVGLPLAIEFGKHFSVSAFDIDKSRINQLKNKFDKNLDISALEISKSKKLVLTNNIINLSECNFIIVTVPTPINKKNQPDLTFLKNACKFVSKILKKKDIVVFESTVYPGLTEEFCVPLIEKETKLKYNKDFFCGYSPERINPNDKKHNIKNIVKITSGSNKKIANEIDKIYRKIVIAGTHKAPSIKIAEAAKVIENAQRDINIAFINELAIIFDKMNIDTSEVLKAASTKWNFLNFKPGLVGGHCIGVDPYYLTYKSKLLGYDPKIISSGRKINDKFVNFVANKSILETKKKFKSKKLKFLILGLSFKENCVDCRNSKSIKLYNILKKRNIHVDCYDPIVDANRIYAKYKIKQIKKFKNNFYHCIILAVSHDIFKKIGEVRFKKQLISEGVFFDFKNTFARNKYNFYI